MSEGLHIDRNLGKKERYQALIPQLSGLLENEKDLVANMANVAALLKEVFGFFWVGFYLVKGGELVLGPFQGSIACTRIGFGKGVCGAAWKTGKTQLVPDVEKFPGHIVCNADSRSELVVPGFKKGKVVWVLDVDSDRLDDFDCTDQEFLEIIAGLIPF
ncbi:MAG: GAF domain-containing protein [Cyclobacteriaceae bacterium]